MEEAQQRGDRPGIEESLTALLGYPVKVAFTNNKRSIISVRSRGRACSVRLHHMFMDADEGLVQSLASFIFKRSGKARERLNAFIRKNSEKIEAIEEGSRKRVASLITEGEHFSLHHCYTKLNRLFFNGTLDCKITWGVRRRRQGRIRVRLGSYCPKNKVIRINPVLDRAFVPAFVLESVVYHEMVHHFIGMREKNGRLVSHHQAFRDLEQSFPLWEKARLWINENLHRLLHLK
jgi:predicted SprT family Zn-dependent metalloprotease